MYHPNKETPVHELINVFPAFYYISLSLYVCSFIPLQDRCWPDYDALSLRVRLLVFVVDHLPKLLLASLLLRGSLLLLAFKLLEAFDVVTSISACTAAIAGVSFVPDVITYLLASLLMLEFLPLLSWVPVLASLLKMKMLWFIINKRFYVWQENIMSPLLVKLVSNKKTW